MNSLQIKELEKKILQLQEINEGYKKQIAARQELEKTLKESEERFRKMFYDSPDATAISRMEDGLFVEVNDRFTEVTGYTREEAIGKTSLELNILSYPEDRARLIAGLKEQGTVINFEALFRMKDGTFIPGLTSATPITLNGIPHILTTHRLIGDIKKVEEDLRRQTAQLQAINHLARKAASSLKPEEVVSATLDSVMETLDPSTALIFIRRGEDLHARGTRATSEKYAHDASHIHRVGQCMCGLAAEKMETIWSEDLFQDPRCTWTECKLAGLRSLAAVPLKVHDRVLGVLTLGDDTQRDFGPEIPMIESLASTTALSLQNAMLFQEVESHKTKLESLVEERTAHLEEKNLELESANLELEKANAMLERMNKLFVGRELRIKELKEKVKELEG